MLSKTDNQLATQVGPGTPMGDTLRRYWMPVLLSTELAEADGVIWTYMGPAEHQPQLPAYEWMRLPNGATSYVSKVWEDCNFLQALEGGIDSSHSSFLHRNFSDTDSTSGIRSYRSRSTSPR